ncbi:hypothetical protein D9756_011052 [Leucocoprinus leucothites]|uniref:Uncharacterized protein n=1 Tax=Leucocoprinus leucothites TaxID=201217 RepID=A0A8H5CPD2_9AGAR|nr:hypothetical protein D9756_011052 [Leucoagaricus leucothites]
MDELVELNGTKRNVLLADSEEREVGSATRHRVRVGVPVNTCICKHIKAFLGDDYPLKNHDIHPPKGSKPVAEPTDTKAAVVSTRRKPAPKRKRANDEHDDEKTL